MAKYQVKLYCDTLTEALGAIYEDVEGLSVSYDGVITVTMEAPDLWTLREKVNDLVEGLALPVYPAPDTPEAVQEETKSSRRGKSS